MLDPAYLAAASDEFLEIYAQVERDIIADVARRIIKTGYLTDTAKWQLERANQIGMLQKDVDKILADATGLSKPAIKDLFSRAGYKALAYDDKIYEMAGKTLIDFTKSDLMKSILLHGTNKTERLMRNLTKTTARNAREALEASLDRAYLQVMSGAFTREQAIKGAVTDLANQGITKLAYASGATISLEAGVRRAISTGLNQTVGDLQLARAAEMGADLVETSSHSGARPSHAEWQGQVFSISGKHKHYPDFYDVTGYGTGPGLCGWNCYHNFFPYFEELSSQSFDRDPSAMLGLTNLEAYEIQQRQRAYERQVRDAKRRIAAYNGALEEADGELAAELSTKLKESRRLLRDRQKRLSDFCERHDLPNDYSRTYTAGYNKPYSIGTK